MLKTIEEINTMEFFSQIKFNKSLKFFKALTIRGLKINKQYYLRMIIVSINLSSIFTFISVIVPFLIA